MPRLRRALAASALLLAASNPARAQDVRFGGATEALGNAFPFGNYHFLPANRYQQLYAASRFAGPVWIDAIRFENGSSARQGDPTAIGAGEYLMRLGPTGRAENALATDFDANPAGALATFHAGAVGPGGLRLAGTPFLYDPARGNLLLDVTVLSQVDFSSLGLDFSRSESDGTSRVFNTFPLPFTPSVVRADAFGLITTFETRPAVVPEPGATALLATGLGALALAHTQRKRGRAARKRG
jgi:hypothetical protein